MKAVRGYGSIEEQHSLLPGGTASLNASGQPTSPPAAPSLPFARPSGCADWKFSFVVLPFAAIMAFIALEAGNSGSFDRLVHGTDFAGAVCGVDARVVNRPFMYWPFATAGDFVSAVEIAAPLRYDDPPLTAVADNDAVCGGLPCDRQ